MAIRPSTEAPAGSASRCVTNRTGRSIGSCREVRNSLRRNAQASSRPSMRSKPIGWWQVAACRQASPPTSTARQLSSSRARGGKFALDTSGSALTGALKHGISLLKPSLSELETIVGQEVRDLPGQMTQAKRLVESGAAEMVALTLGAGGAILATAERVIHVASLCRLRENRCRRGRQLSRRLGLRPRRTADA